MSSSSAAATPRRRPRMERHWSRPFDVDINDPYGPKSVALYRHFNEYGALLYVGISDNPKRRFGEHAHAKSWWTDVAAWTVRWHPDRAAAELEEERAIREEVPAYNLLGVPDTADEEDLLAKWLVALRRRRPGVSDLNELYLAWLRLRSLPDHPRPRTAWTDRGIRFVYSRVRERAGWLTLRDHAAAIEWLERRFPHLTFPPVPLMPPEKKDWDSEFLRWQSKAACRSRRRAVGLGVRCTRSSELVEYCACASRHVVDYEDANRFGRPPGTPFGAPNRRWQPVPVAIAS